MGIFRRRGAVATAAFIFVAMLSGAIVGHASSGDLPPNAERYEVICTQPGTDEQQTRIERPWVADIYVRYQGASEAPCGEPLPEAALGVPIDPAKGYAVEEVSNGLYWITDGIYQTIFLTTGEGVIVVDAPPTLGANILAGIGEVTDETVTHVIYSHSHADHIAAAGVFPVDATYIAHEIAAEEIVHSQRDDRRYPYGVFVGGGPIPLPTETFSENYSLSVGNQTLELSYRGPAHEPGNIYIYAPDQKVLMLVDVVFPGWSPFKSLALAEDVPAYIDAHDEILSFDFEVFVGGHVGRPGTREDVEIQRDYIMDVEASAVAALQRVNPVDIGLETGFQNTWLFFDTYLDEVTHVCAEAAIPHWVQRLGGVDVFTADHCLSLINSLRLD